MFLSVSGNVCGMDEDQRKQLAGAIQARRKAIFGTKSAAYKKAGVNSATWDRAEEGEPIRDHSMAAIVKTLWPASEGDPDRISGHPEDWPEYPDSDPRFWDGADAAQRNDLLFSWIADNFVRINNRLAELEASIAGVDVVVTDDAEVVEAPAQETSL